MKSDPLAAPRLKVARAKQHIDELKSKWVEFAETYPYEIITENSPDGTENIWRVRVHKPLPCEFSVIIGDAAHNLRAALDQLVCVLIYANGKQPRNRSGFPVGTSSKSFEEAVPSKLTGVSARAERFIRRLQPYKGGNAALWTLHELDAMDKHLDIVPVAAGTIAAMRHDWMPFSFEGGVLTIGGEGSVFSGVPTGFKPVFPLEGEIEIYRAKAALHTELEIHFAITLDKTKVLEGGEPVLELLRQLTKFVERTLNIVERHLL